MRKTAFLVLVCYLPGCTLTVLNLEKGIEKSWMPLTADVESAWRNPISQEYVICMKDSAHALDKKKAHFTLKIPENRINEGKPGFIEYSKWFVSELKPKGEQHWWTSDYKGRNSVQVYGVSLRFEYGCSEPDSHWTKLQLLRTPTDINTTDAILFRGETLRQLIARKQPFAIFSSSTSDKAIIDSDFAKAPSISVCINVINGACLMLVTKPQVQANGTSQSSYSEILIPDQLILSYNPQPLWYLAVPFAVIADVAIVGASIFVLILKAG